MKNINSSQNFDYADLNKITKVIKTVTFYISKLVIIDYITMDFFMKIILLKKYNQMQGTSSKFKKRGEVTFDSDVIGSSQKICDQMT